MFNDTIVMQQQFLDKAQELVNTAKSLEQNSQDSKVGTLSALRAGLEQTITISNRLHDAHSNLFTHIAETIDQDGAERLLEYTENILSRSIALEKNAKTSVHRRIFQQVALAVNDLAISIIEKAGEKSKSFYTLCQGKIEKASNSLKTMLNLQTLGSEIPTGFLKPKVNIDDISIETINTAVNEIKTYFNVLTEISSVGTLINTQLSKLTKFTGNPDKLKEWANAVLEEDSNAQLLNASIRATLKEIYGSLKDSTKNREAVSITHRENILVAIYKLYLGLITHLLKEDSRLGMKKLREMLSYIKKAASLDQLLEFFKVLESCDLASLARTSFIEGIEEASDELTHSLSASSTHINEIELKMLSSVANTLRFINRRPKNLQNFSQDALFELARSLIEMLEKTFERMPDHDYNRDNADMSFKDAHYRHRELIADLVSIRNFIVSVADLSHERETAKSLTQPLNDINHRANYNSIQHLFVKLAAHYSQHQFNKES